MLTCHECHEPIGVYEPVICHQPDGTRRVAAYLDVRASSNEIASSERFYHQECAPGSSDLADR